jgi:hypothetical protein
MTWVVFSYHTVFIGIQQSKSGKCFSCAQLQFIVNGVEIYTLLVVNDGKLADMSDVLILINPSVPCTSVRIILNLQKSRCNS